MSAPPDSEARAGLPRVGFPLVLTSEQMRRFDQEVAGRTGLPSLILMENAGRGVTDAIRQRWPPPAERRRVVVILCGGGNNGGDGFVVARHLSSSAGSVGGRRGGGRDPGGAGRAALEDRR